MKSLVPKESFASIPLNQQEVLFHRSSREENKIYFSSVYFGLQNTRIEYEIWYFFFVFLLLRSNMFNAHKTWNVKYDESERQGWISRSALVNVYFPNNHSGIGIKIRGSDKACLI